MARRPRHQHEEHLNHEAWAIPYADLLTLLLAFFVVMYAISSLNEGKYRVVADSLSAAFTATIYGIASANLLFLPVCAKLKSVIAHTSRDREMIIEGLIAIAQGENPRNIENSLAGFLN